MTTMTDNNGNLVPIQYVSKYDRLRDRVCRRILKRFQDERERLEKTMKECLADIEELRNAKTPTTYKTKDGVERVRGERGNFQAQSFDGKIMIEIRQQYNIILDERVQQARQLMLDYVNGVLAKVSGADTTVLRRLVESAFRANSRGFLPVTKIFELMRMEVKDERWNQAREILNAAIKPQKGKQYLNCSTRKSTQGEFESIKLDLADCWPEEA